MSEENKEVKKEEPAAPKPEAPAETAAPKPAPAAAAPAAPKEELPKKKEKPANCAACNKSIKKKRHYYRDGKFYCTKRCWLTTRKKEEKPQDTEAKS